MKADVVYLLLCTSLATQQGTPTGRADSAAEEHIRHVIRSLPPDSTFRDILEGGARGDGIHHPWMDKMRDQGVKRALVRTRFEWHGRPTAVTVIDVLYFSKYDNDCAQITDPKRLEEIRGSGLERELKQAAIGRTEKAPWYFTVDRPVRHAKRGMCGVVLLDDGRLPVPPAMLAPVAKDPDQLVGAVLRGDEAGVERLIKRRTSPKELSAAMQSLAIGGDSCIARLLLNAGADANTLGEDGYTPLIEAVRAQKPAIVKALLEAGADVKAKDRWGETALSIAQRNNYAEIVRLLKQAAATD
jgi:hypothetical protein